MLQEAEGSLDNVKAQMANTDVQSLEEMQHASEERIQTLQATVAEQQDAVAGAEQDCGQVAKDVAARQEAQQRAKDAQALVVDAQATIADFRKEAKEWATVQQALPSVPSAAVPAQQIQQSQHCDQQDSQNHGAATAGLTDLAECRAACERCKKAHERAQKAAASMPRAQVSAERRAALQQRSDTLKAAEDKLQVLHAASDAIRADMRTAKGAALQLNEQVFERAAEAFSASMAGALPDFRFRMARAGKTAADGVSIHFRKLGQAQTDGSEPSADAASPTAQAWSANLAELSGGQRSLCSLAFLLAASGAGIAPALLLVDEVDAALDDVNQTRVGDMLQHCSQSMGCQVLAVSHSAAFHGYCAAFVKVSRDVERGTSAHVARGTDTAVAHAKAINSSALQHAQHEGKLGRKHKQRKVQK